MENIHSINKELCLFEQNTIIDMSISDRINAVDRKLH